MENKYTVLIPPNKPEVSIISSEVVDNINKQYEDGKLTIVLDDELVIKHLDDLAESNPDFQYRTEYGANGCVYFTYKNGRRAPACIVGHVFDRLGVLDQLPIELNGAAISALINMKVFETKPETTRMLSRAQTLQDSNFTWRDAVNSAHQANS